MFNIAFTNIDAEEIIGKIEINEFSEFFSSTFEYWSLSQYTHQWSEATKRLSSGLKTSAFITSITDPKDSNFIRWWL